jgi:hypothetical protein
MAKSIKTSDHEYDLQLLMDNKGWNVEEAAVALGDTSQRLRRVLAGQEPLGRTATLAAMAMERDLDPISKLR